jgi:hypothetical protein
MKLSGSAPRTCSFEEGLAKELVDVERGLSLRLGRCEPTTAQASSLMWTCSVGFSHGWTPDEESYLRERKLFDLLFHFHHRDHEAVLVFRGDVEHFTFISSIMERYIGVDSTDEQRGILFDATHATIRLIVLSDLIPSKTHRLSLLVRRSHAAWLGLQGEPVETGGDPFIKVAACELAR